MLVGVQGQTTDRVGRVHARDWRDKKKLSRLDPPGFFNRLSRVPSRHALKFLIPSRPASRQDFWSPVPANPANVVLLKRRSQLTIIIFFLFNVFSDPNQQWRWFFLLLCRHTINRYCDVTRGRLLSPFVLLTGLENVEKFEYLGSLLTWDNNCSDEIKGG